MFGRREDRRGNRRDGEMFVDSVWRTGRQGGDVIGEIVCSGVRSVD